MLVVREFFRFVSGIFGRLKTPGSRRSGDVARVTTIFGPIDGSRLKDLLSVRPGSLGSSGSVYVVAGRVASSGLGDLSNIVAGAVCVVASREEERLLSALNALVISLGVAISGFSIASNRDAAGGVYSRFIYEFKCEDHYYLPPPAFLARPTRFVRISDFSSGTLYDMLPPSLKTLSNEYPCDVVCNDRGRFLPMLSCTITIVLINTAT